MGTCRCGASWSGARIEHCCACHESFSCESAGDMHRVGRHDVSTGPNRRRCLTVQEMLAKGMIPNARGVWMSRAREVA